jgi:hypothetical protein
MKLTTYDLEQIEAASHSVEQILAVSECADCTISEAIEHLDRGRWIALTDDQADEKATGYILDAVWAFKAQFLAEHFPAGITHDMIDRLRGDQCESINEAFRALLVDEDLFVHDAIGAAGRGHFMYSYDGEEYEASNGLYCYRMD